jgi:DNA-binding protein YbaB
MNNEPLDPATIEQITRTFAHVFDPVTQEPATSEVAGLLSVSVDSTFRVARVSLASGLVGEEVRGRLEDAIATAVNEAYQAMTLRHADVLQASLLQSGSAAGERPRVV